MRLLTSVCLTMFTAACGVSEPAHYGQTRAAVIGAIEKAAADGRTLSGQQVNEYEVFIECTSFERIYELTGEWPAILGLELMFIIENPAYREFFVARAEEHAARSGIVAVTWHARNPIKVCPRGEYYKCSQMAMSGAELDRILQPGTPEHRLWQADVDAIADVLRELDEKGIAPLFRPYHEMNGGWFWWGRKDRYADLWSMLYARLSEHHDLQNLIWVWSPDKESEGAEAFYPGDEFVDLVGADIYTDDRSAPMFEAAKANVAPLHASGLFAFTEIGKLPAMEIFSRVQPAYFLLWGGEFINIDWAAEPCDWCNDAGDVADIYAAPEVISLRELKWPENSGVIFTDSKRTAPPDVSCPASLVDSRSEGSQDD